MSNEIFNVPDTWEHATEAKRNFGDDYQQYCDYCAQYTSASDENGNTLCIRVIPLTEKQYRGVQIYLD